MDWASLLPLAQAAGADAPYIIVIGILARAVFKLHEQLQHVNKQLLEMAVTAQQALMARANGKGDEDA